MRESRRVNTQVTDTDRWMDGWMDNGTGIENVDLSNTSVALFNNSVCG